MSGIKLIPEGGEDPIEVPTDSIVIGRGAFLKVTDKRVSRSHAMMEVIDGKLHLTPTHTNPCFLRKAGEHTNSVLARSVQECLEDGDVFSLLPDQLFYRISYSTLSCNRIGNEYDNKVNSAKCILLSKPKSGKKGNNDSGADCIDNKLSCVKVHADNFVQADGKNMALPLTKIRRLPAWMTSLARSSDFIMHKSVEVEPGGKTGGVDIPARQQPSISPRTSVAKRRSVHNFIHDGVKTEDRASLRHLKGSSDENYNDESEEELPRRSHGKRGRCRNSTDDDFSIEDERPRKGRRKRRSYSSDEETSRGEACSKRFQQMSVMGGLRARPPRAATQKRGSYVEDFMVGVDFDDSDDPPAKPDDNDSDFMVDGNEEEAALDSGSDWEGQKVSRKQRKADDKGRKRKHRPKSDSSDFEDEFDVEYVPRKSKFRNGGRIQKSNQGGSDDDGDDFLRAASSRSSSKGLTRTMGHDTSGRKGKKPCYYGNKCYRRNPDHYEQFSHPDDLEEEEDDGGDGGSSSH